MVQKRLRWATAPMARPAARLIQMLAPMDPGPVALKKSAPSGEEETRRARMTKSPVRRSETPTRSLAVHVGPAQAVPVFNEEHPDTNPGDEPQEAHHGVQVAAGQAQERPPGTAEEDQCADHGEDAEEKADDRG